MCQQQPQWVSFIKSCRTYQEGIVAKKSHRIRNHKTIKVSIIPKLKERMGIKHISYDGFTICGPVHVWDLLKVTW